MNSFEAGAGFLADCREDFGLGMKPFDDVVALCISPCFDGECPLRSAESCCCHCFMILDKKELRYVLSKLIKARLPGAFPHTRRGAAVLIFGTWGYKNGRHGSAASVPQVNF